MRKRLFPLILFLFTVTVAQQSDSIKSYRLQEITVKSGVIIESKSVVSVDTLLLKSSDAISLNETAKLIPSVKSQTNSRGETLFYLRGSGERQIGLLLNGIPLNVPWDNRIDLSLVPTDAVSEINITRGPASVTYGANALAGVLNVFTQHYSGNSEGRISAGIGSGNFQKYSGSWIDGGKNYSYLVSMSYKNKNGYQLPDSYKENFPGSGELRNNSYSSSANFFINLDYQLSSLAEITATGSFLTAEKGVPPEMNVSSPRYWQYPEWKKHDISLNSKIFLNSNKNTFLNCSFSATKFKMQINQYEDVTYSSFDDIEKNDDITYRGKILFTKFFGRNHVINVSLSNMYSLHKESFLATEFNVLNKYSQNIYSAGIEYEYADEKLTTIFGIGIDGSSTPLTGDKPSSDPITDFSINSSIVYSLSNALSLRFNYGRKTRFPTLRESFSGALGKFIINPELKAEVVNSLETGLSFNNQNITANANLFLSFLEDGIVRGVVTDTDGAKKYKRINEDAIRNYGLELYSTIKFTSDLLAQVNLTFLNSFAKNSENEYKDTLEYKAGYLGTFFLDYKITENINSLLEVSYVGNEFALQGGNEYFQKLPEYILLNLRISYSSFIKNNFSFETYLRVNNVFDKLYYAQWGLPEAGREFLCGIIITI